MRRAVGTSGSGSTVGRRGHHVAAARGRRCEHAVITHEVQPRAPLGGPVGPRRRRDGDREREAPRREVPRRRTIGSVFARSSPRVPAYTPSPRRGQTTAGVLRRDTSCRRTDTTRTELWLR